MRKGVSRWMLAVIAGMALSLGVVTVSAAADQTGLGASWPNAQDVSQNASLHAYRWARDGVEFVQVNGADGTPLAAIATDGHTVMVLPVGNPAIVSVANTGSSTQGAAVYSDTAVTIQATSNGLSVQPLRAAACSDPIECSKPKAAAAAATTTNGSTQIQAMACDPIECSKPVN